ncbi:MAG: hypothetical protein MZV64_02755 [Ignavibacteriales bacterium]|nr:hypothetical protein [Ignavibacteriales bacterium]
MRPASAPAPRERLLFASDFGQEPLPIPLGRFQPFRLGPHLLHQTDLLREFPVENFLPPPEGGLLFGEQPEIALVVLHDAFLILDPDERLVDGLHREEGFPVAHPPLPVQARHAAADQGLLVRQALERLPDPAFGLPHVGFLAPLLIGQLSRQLLLKSDPPLRVLELFEKGRLSGLLGPNILLDPADLFRILDNPVEDCPRAVMAGISTRKTAAVLNRRPVFCSIIAAKKFSISPRV